MDISYELINSTSCGQDGDWRQKNKYAPERSKKARIAVVDLDGGTQEIVTKSGT